MYQILLYGNLKLDGYIAPKANSKLILSLREVRQRRTIEAIRAPFSFEKTDCFATLAMTVKIVCSFFILAI